MRKKILKMMKSYSTKKMQKHGGEDEGDGEDAEEGGHQERDAYVDRLVAP